MAEFSAFRDEKISMSTEGVVLKVLEEFDVPPAKEKVLPPAPARAPCPSSGRCGGAGAAALPVLLPWAGPGPGLPVPV